jgi:hypothetical protein
MSEPVRRNLLAGLTKAQPEPSNVEDAAIALVAERHGFARPEQAPSVPAEPAAQATPTPHVDGAGEGQGVTRRHRTLRGRTQQINVRLKPATCDVIYAESNNRDIPVAQVIEEMVAAFLAMKERAGA